MVNYTDKISIEQAYLAAYEYLLHRWESTPEHRIADELSDMSLLADGASADPACRSEFLQAVNAVLIAQSQPDGYTRARQRLV